MLTIRDGFKYEQSSFTKGGFKERIRLAEKACFAKVTACQGTSGCGAIQDECYDAIER